MSALMLPQSGRGAGPALKTLRRDNKNDFKLRKKKIEKKGLPTKKQEGSLENKEMVIKKINYHDIDQKLIKIDEKLKLLYHLRPINLNEQKEEFFKNFKNYDIIFLFESLFKLCIRELPCS